MFDFKFACCVCCLGKSMYPHCIEKTFARNVAAILDVTGVNCHVTWQEYKAKYGHENHV